MEDSSCPPHRRHSAQWLQARTSVSLGSDEEIEAAGRTCGGVVACCEREVLCAEGRRARGVVVYRAVGWAQGRGVRRGASREATRIVVVGERGRHRVEPIHGRIRGCSSLHKNGRRCEGLRCLKGGGRCERIDHLGDRSECEVVVSWNDGGGLAAYSFTIAFI